MSRVDTIRRRLEAHSVPEPNSGCLLWDGAYNPRGYGQLNVRQVPRLAHRLSWEQANGPIPSGLLVLHKCDVPACINPDHLFLGTQADNIRDMVEKKRYGRHDRRGARNGYVKLTDADVRKIRSDDRLQRVVASDYGVTQSAISRIKLRKNWSHL